MYLFTLVSQSLFTALYFLAAICYLLFFFKLDKHQGRRAANLLAGALGIHSFALIIRIAILHYLPLATTGDALSFSGLIIGLAYFTIEKASRDNSMGAFILPLITSAEGLSLLFFHPSDRLNNIFNSHWFEVHVSSSMFAFSAFTLAFIGALLYLLLYAEIRAKRPGRFYRRLTSLQRLDRVNWYGSLLGTCFLLLAIVTGYFWLKEITAGRPDVDARIIASWFTLAVYASQLLLRRSRHWNGRRSSYCSITGFILVICAFAFEGVIG